MPRQGEAGEDWKGLFGGCLKGVSKNCCSKCSLESNSWELDGLQRWRNPDCGCQFCGSCCREMSVLWGGQMLPSKQCGRPCFLGSEWRYVILSTVRSCPRSEIDRKPTKSWQKKHLGFVTDPNQVNVAITRAQEGLCILGG